MNFFQRVFGQAPKEVPAPIVSKPLKPIPTDAQIPLPIQSEASFELQGRIVEGNVGKQK